MTAFSGLPVTFGLVAANTDERAASAEVLSSLRTCDIFGDKGFIGEEWQQGIKQQSGNRIWAINRVKQKEQKGA